MVQLMSGMALILLTSLLACESRSPRVETDSAFTKQSPVTATVIPQVQPTDNNAPSRDPEFGTTPVPQPTGTPPPPSSPSGMAPASATSHSGDRDVLVAFYHATGGANWKNASNWLSDAPVAEWAGVTTNADGRVTRLDLARNHLTGEIPSGLGSLSKLTVLNLSRNLLNGEIPPKLGNLSNLRVLSLGGNSLTGEIPPELGQLTNLKRLDLRDFYDVDGKTVYDQFTGCLPEGLHGFLSGIEVSDVDQLLLGICTGKDVVVAAGGEAQVYNDNVFVLPVAEDIVANFPLKLSDYTKRFYEYFDDAFDFLIVLPNLYRFESLGIKEDHGIYFRLSNNVQGIGLEYFNQSRAAGSSGKLRGMIRLPHNGMLDETQRWVLLHELMHRWGDFVISPSSAHYSFSSANGMLGGFDIGDLVDLGDGRFTVRSGRWSGGGSWGYRDRYSPIELYVAGLLPAEEVPDLWVAEDVDWVRDQDGRLALAEGKHPIFKPGKVRTLTIEDIIAEHGRRLPDVSKSQKDFRAAVILLVDEKHPAIQWQLDNLSNGIADFSRTEPDETDDRLNFHEATGGRASIAMGGLSRFLKLDGKGGKDAPEGIGEVPAAFSLVSAGSRHTCGLTADYSAACWGNNEDGQVTPPDGEFSSINAGSVHTCGIKRDGSLACWGRDEHGQSMPPGGEFTAVSSGSWHACAIKRDGSVACWGFNRDGQATPPDGEFISVSAGMSHTCGMIKDGSVACWGGHVLGQATPPDGEFTSVSAGGTHTCGVKRDGSVTCWGSNTRGQATPPVGEFISVSSGLFHTCGVREDGPVVCWGNDKWGQATPPEGEFASVSAGSWYNCGMKRDGSVACWGYNSDGQATPP